MATIKVINFNFKTPEDAVVVNTTSRSDNWGSGLSPFFLGPCELYDGYTSKNVENCWKFSKVYGQHCEDGEPTPAYFEWAKKGWNDIRAHRYPMGRGAIPEFSYWDGEKLSYVEARHKIYIPCYSKAVRDTDAFKKLTKLYNETEGTLYLADFDSHSLNRENFEYADLWNNPKIKVGHAYVLAMMLEGLL